MTERVRYIIHRPPVHSIPATGEVCTNNRRVANVAPLASALRQCPYFESGGAQCEAEAGHEGRHDFTDAIFHFMQRRYGERQGPVCRTRRYGEYVYEDDGNGEWW